MLFGLFICSFIVPVHVAILPNANMARPPTKASIQTTAQTAQTKASQAPKLARILSAPTAIVGGEAGSGFSLLNIKKKLSASGRVERLSNT